MAFLGGDPDRPVVIGRVYTNLQKSPYKLPEHRTQSGWKSQSTPGGDGFNEIRFEDAKGKEEIYVQAERDRTTLVKHDDDLTVFGDRTKLVQKDEDEKIALNKTVTVGVNRTTYVGAVDATTAGERIRLETKAGAKITIDGPNITLDGAHILLRGTMIRLTPTGDVRGRAFAKTRAGAARPAKPAKGKQRPADNPYAKPPSAPTPPPRELSEQEFPLPIEQRADGRVQVGKRIQILPEPTRPRFQSEILKSLRIIAAHPRGAELLERLDKADKDVAIKYGRYAETEAVGGPTAWNDATALGHDLVPFGERRDPRPSLDAAAFRQDNVPLVEPPAPGHWLKSGLGTGLGAASSIKINPDYQPRMTLHPDKFLPTDVALAHELKHAERIAYGLQDTSADLLHPNNPDVEEATVLAWENSYRVDRGIKQLRVDHTTF